MVGLLGGGGGRRSLKLRSLGILCYQNQSETRPAVEKVGFKSEKYFLKHNSFIVSIEI